MLINSARFPWLKCTIRFPSGPWMIHVLIWYSPPHIYKTMNKLFYNRKFISLSPWSYISIPFFLWNFILMKYILCLKVFYWSLTHTSLQQECVYTLKSLNCVCFGTSLVVQWVRLCTPNSGGPGSIPGQGTRSRMLLLSLRAPTKTLCSLNK